MMSSPSPLRLVDPVKAGGGLGLSALTREIIFVIYAGVQQLIPRFLKNIDEYFCKFRPGSLRRTEWAGPGHGPKPRKECT